MSNAINVRWKWLTGMYVYTMLGAGGLGLGLLFKPDTIAKRFGWTGIDPVALGIIGSMLLAFAVLSGLGLRSPLKFVPVLLLQLCYKTIWFIGVILPLLVKGQLPQQTIPLVIIYATYVVGDIIAIPFADVFAKE